jgi:cytochrome c biogenesis protein CcmG/thiol:disulfide interchange protein DsbE
MIGKPLPRSICCAGRARRPGLASRPTFAGGKPRLLNIFASWCIPARSRRRSSMRCARRGGDRRRRHPRPARGRRGVPRPHGNPFARIGADDVSAVQLALGSSGVPETFVIDGKGVIRYQHIGEIRPEACLPLILAKLKEAAQ